MAEARRYIVTRTTIEPSGIGTATGVTTQFDLTDGFSGTRPDGSTYNFGPISLVELANLTDALYNERLDDFFLFIGTEDLFDRVSLRNDSTFDEPTC